MFTLDLLEEYFKLIFIYFELKNGKFSNNIEVQKE